MVAAVEEATGRVVGFTEINLFPHRDDVAFQGDTAVLAEHPHFSQVFTVTSAANPHVLGVNHRLGYYDAQTNLVLGQDVEELLAR